MAGYVKVWTTIKNNEGFLSLSLQAKGAYLLLLITAKEQRDDGTVFYRNYSAMGADWGCERTTAGKILGKLRENSLLTYTQNGDGVLAITIANYKKWQELDVKTLVANSRKNPREIPPLRPDQTIPYQTIPYRAVIEHLNLLANKNFGIGENNKKWIKARCNEGFR